MFDIAEIEDLLGADIRYIESNRIYVRFKKNITFYNAIQKINKFRKQHNKRIGFYVQPDNYEYAVILIRPLYSEGYVMPIASYFDISKYKINSAVRQANIYYNGSGGKSADTDPLCDACVSLNIVLDMEDDKIFQRITENESSIYYEDLEYSQQQWIQNMTEYFKESVDHSGEK